MKKVFIEYKRLKIREQKSDTIVALEIKDESMFDCKNKVDNIFSTFFGKEYLHYPILWEDIDSENEIVYKTVLKSVLDNQDIRFYHFTSKNSSFYERNINIVKMMKYIILKNPEEDIIFHVSTEDFDRKSIRIIRKLVQFTKKRRYDINFVNTFENRLAQVSKLSSCLISSFENDQFYFDNIGKKPLKGQLNLISFFYTYPKKKNKVKQLLRK